MIPALLYEKIKDKWVICHLCAHECRLNEGKVGACRARKNINGDLFSLNSDRVIAMNMDPVEKKPLYHVLPGSYSFSIAAMGCNFACHFCQNHSISMIGGESDIRGDTVSPGQLVAIALENRARSISYTYTEPTVFFELVLETARLARQAGLKNILVSNGYMTRKAQDMLEPFLDAANIDLKSFSDDFYKKYCHARLQPVVETISSLKAVGVWVEVTTLLIPGLNDDQKELSRLAAFIAGLDAHIPWHVSRFFPQHLMQDIPPTSTRSIHEVLQVGANAGLKFLYGGNIADSHGNNTPCPNCREILIKRSGYTSEILGLQSGNCRFCGKMIPGIWI